MNVNLAGSGSRSKPEEPSAFSACDPGLPLLKKNVSPDDWGDWHWQMRNRIRDVKSLKAYLPGLARLGELERVTSRFPLAITPYYLSLIRDGDPTDPVYLMSVPRVEELENPLELDEDPLDEEADMPRRASPTGIRIAR